MTKYPIEVFTYVERRRRWSREDKERLVASCFEPDAGISEVARAAGIHVCQLFRWRKELCPTEEPAKHATPTLVPVIMSDASPAAQPAATESPMKCSASSWNKREPCLSVRIDSQGVQSNCHH